jgi:hypothetical protein
VSIWRDDSLLLQCGFSIWVHSVQNGGNDWFAERDDPDFPWWHIVPELAGVRCSAEAKERIETWQIANVTALEDRND